MWRSLCSGIVLLLIFLTPLLSACRSGDNPGGDPAEDPGFEKGVFALRDEQKLMELGAAYTRLIVWDTHIKAIYDKVDAGTPVLDVPDVKKIVAIHDAGLKIILTIRWPVEPPDDQRLYDRVPIGDDRQASLALLTRFLNDIGPYVDIYSLQNEVGGLGPGSYKVADMTNTGAGSPAVGWLTELALTARQVIAGNPALSHLRLSSPAPIALKKMVFESTTVPLIYQEFFYEVLAFANLYTDYIDIHVNNYTLSELPVMLAYLEPLVDRDLISTEWSEIASAQAWINDPVDPVIYTTAAQLAYNLPAGINTNLDLIMYFYTSPAPPELWNQLVALSGYEADFMHKSSKLLAQYDFRILCWNSGWQEGDPVFDTRSFYATLTVANNANQEVRFFTDEFKRL